jgi:hypothetical protein
VFVAVVVCASRMHWPLLRDSCNVDVWTIVVALMFRFGSCGW